MKQDPSKEAGCSYETLARQMNVPKEHVDNKEALTKQLQERVNELHRQLERLEKEKEAQVRQLQEQIKKLENQLNCLGKQKEANEIRETPTDDQAYGDRIAKEENVHRHDVDNSEKNTQEGVKLIKDRHLEDEAEQKRQHRIAFLRQRLKQLEERARAIRKGLRSIPERKHVWQSPGICSTMECVFCRKAGCHYSDSCPVITDGDERHRIVRKRGRCHRCMEHCERRGYCAYVNKECFYCSKAKNTVFAECKPKDDRHHSALCSISIRMQEAKRELDQLENDIQHCQLELAHL
ncbi:unnamed protein product [Heligmosomoides polygyrus]|uniref:CCHC-type domain-containing protein n=1 Tax=Heligmosomoides polygyrus TaxID=6339 RepID=A0A183GA88_HELPZ|nr:unnamed protein product [Heligmosomoides polygyrus]